MYSLCIHNEEEHPMKTRLKMWGNSLGLRIPGAFAKETRLKENSVVDLTLEDGKLIIEPVKKSDITLESLLDAIEPGNLHEEVDTGPAQGHEPW